MLEGTHIPGMCPHESTLIVIEMTYYVIHFILINNDAVRCTFNSSNEVNNLESLKTQRYSIPN